MESFLDVQCVFFDYKEHKDEEIASEVEEDEGEKGAPVFSVRRQRRLDS